MNDPYEVLGLKPCADRSEAKRAYQRLKELYSQDSLAIYTIVTEEERRERLESVESAYQNILALLREAGDGSSNQPQPSSPETVPDPEVSTGAYLRWAREQAGLSIRELAERTKISSGRIEDIESERADHLPPPVYLRGFVFEFARSLGLANAFQLAELYLKRVSPSMDDPK